MSRSFKKVFGYKDRCPIMKRYANKRVRQNKEFSVGGRAYKKLSCSYDICDYKFLYFSYNELRNLIRDSRYYTKENIHKLITR